MTEHISFFISTADVTHLSTSHICWLRSISFFGIVKQSQSFFTSLCSEFLLPWHIIISWLWAAQCSDLPLKAIYLNSLSAELMLKYVIIHIKTRQWQVNVCEWIFPSWRIIKEIALKSCIGTGRWSQAQENMGTLSSWLYKPWTD